MKIVERYFLTNITQAVFFVLAAFLALTPGAVNQDIPSLPFHRVQRPVYPLDPEMPDPAFDVRLIGDRRGTS